MDDFAYQWPYTNMTQPRGAEIDRLEKLSALSAQIETLSRTFEAFEAQRRQSVAVTCDYCAGNHMSHQCAISFEPVQYSGDYPNSYVYPNNYHQDCGYHPNFSWSNNQDQFYAPSPTYPPNFSCPPPLQHEEHSNLEEALEKFIRASDKRNEEQDKKMNQIELNLQSQGASLKNLENQLGQIAHALNNRPQYTWLHDMDDETDDEPEPNLQSDVPNDIDVEREERLGDQQKEIDKDLTLSTNEDEPILIVSHVPSPPKFKNSGSFAKPCPIGSHVVGKALCDIRASTVVESWWDEKEKIEEDSIMFIKLQCPNLIIDIMEKTPSCWTFLIGNLSTKSMLGDFNSRVFANGNLPKETLLLMDGGFLNFRRGIG